MEPRRRLPLLVAIVAILAVGVPVVMAADPSPKPGPPDHAGAKTKAPKVEVTLNGTIVQGTDDKGRPTFTMTAGGTTYELSAGPMWFHGTGGGPLAAHAGKSVEIHGWQREGTTDVSVDTVDGTALRAAGRPPWAGGPKALGERHPGWKAWKAEGANGFPGRGLGRDHAPGQLKEKPADDEATDSD
jgi:hypothetical protein